MFIPGLFIVLGWLALDQATKFWMLDHLMLHEPQQVTSFFSLTLHLNTGAAFSFLASASGWQRWFLSGVAVLATLFFLSALYRTSKQAPWSGVGYASIIGGAVGNLIDRLHTGLVVDFLHFHWHEWYWPAFNVADIAISVGLGCLLIGWMRGEV